MKRMENLNQKAKNRRSLTAVLVVALFLVCLCCLAGCGQGEKADQAGNAAASQVKKEPVEIRILCVGDIMAHRPQLLAAYDGASGSYDFAGYFQYVKPYIEKADLALCNVETTFAGGAPCGYPKFNSPDSLADAIKDAGFDVGITSNNHMMDTGYDGVVRTLSVLQEAGLKTVGSHEAGSPGYLLTKVNDVTVGVVAYTYETPQYEGKRTINAMPVGEESRAMINSFGYGTLEEDLQTIADTVQAARDAGAEIVICYYHWGEEYQRSPNEYQQRIAWETAERMGADVIFASHPHVLQGVEVLTLEENGKKVPVYYSMGNFISNQRQETLDNRYTEQGMMATVTLRYDPESGNVEPTDCGAIPTWVDKYTSGGATQYVIVPLTDGWEENETLRISGHKNRAGQALQDITKLIGTDRIR